MTLEIRHRFGIMAHAAAHLKKARELEQPPELKALAKARERRKRHRERAERKRKVPTLKKIVLNSDSFDLFFSL